MADEDRAIAAIPAMLPVTEGLHELVFDAVQRVVPSGAPLPAASQARLAQIKSVLLHGRPQARPADRRLGAVGN